MQKTKDKKNFKSYVLAHKANANKEQLLFNLYNVYAKEYKAHTKVYWKNFLHNTINTKIFPVV